MRITSSLFIPTKLLYILFITILLTLFLQEDYRSFNDRRNSAIKKRRFSRAVNTDHKSKLDTKESFIDEHLEIVNKYRALHGSAPLEVDYKLAEEAEKWAKHLAEKTDEKGKPVLDPSWTYLTGENMFAQRVKDPSTVTGTAVATKWYSGCKAHAWDKNVFQKTSARFSQLVWRESEFMGIGKAHAAKEGITIVVARYLPPGNWAYTSPFKANVFPRDGSDKCYEATATENITNLKVTLPKRAPKDKTSENSKTESGKESEKATEKSSSGSDKTEDSSSKTTESSSKSETATEGSKSEAKTENSKSETTEASKSEAKTESSKSETTEASKSETKTESSKSETTEASKSETKTESSKSETTEASKSETKTESSKSETTEASKGEATTAESSKSETTTEKGKDAETTTPPCAAAAGRALVPVAGTTNKTQSSSNTTLKEKSTESKLSSTKGTQKTTEIPSKKNQIPLGRNMQGVTPKDIPKDKTTQIPKTTHKITEKVKTEKPKEKEKPKVTTAKPKEKEKLKPTEKFKQKEISKTVKPK